MIGFVNHHLLILTHQSVVVNSDNSPLINPDKIRRVMAMAMPNVTALPVFSVTKARLLISVMHSGMSVIRRLTNK